MLQTSHAIFHVQSIALYKFPGASPSVGQTVSKKMILPMSTKVLVGGLALWLSGAPVATAAEGGASHYLPGATGDFGFALPPNKGAQVVNITWLQSGHANTAVLQDRVSFGLDTEVLLDLLAGLYAFEDEVLGARYSVGMVVPFGRAELNASLDGPMEKRFEVDGSHFDLADVTLIPLQLNWSSGNLHFEVAESIILPTGGYETSEIVNLGRNYWSSDSVAAFTWLDPEAGTEVSLSSGIMWNSRNDETDYRTGVEFHLDAVANQFLSSNFAVGLRGYWYDQLTGDSGSGALLGDFESESYGLGGGVIWTPEFAGGSVSVSAKAMVDLYSKNRFDSTYSQLTIGWVP